MDRTESAYEWLERRLLRGGLDALAMPGDDSQPIGGQIVDGMPAEAQRTAIAAAAADVLVDLVPNNDLVLAVRPSQGVWRLRMDGLGAARQALVTRPRAKTALTELLLLIEQGPGSAIETDSE